ncbi:MAG: PAS domain S-box protein [Myxococcales bacterium]
MKQPRSRRGKPKAFRSLFGPLVVGLGLPLLGGVVSASSRSLPVNPTTVLAAHTTQPPVWLLDVASLALVAALVALRRRRVALGYATARISEYPSSGDERRYLRTALEVSQLLNQSTDVDQLAEVIRAGLDLHGVNLAILDPRQDSLVLQGVSTALPGPARGIIKRVAFKFRDNPVARKYFEELDGPRTITVAELTSLLIPQDSPMASSLGLLSRIIGEADMGEMLVSPLTASRTMRIGAMLVAKRSGYFSNESERSLLSNLCHTVSIALGRQRALEALEQSEARYRRLFSHSSDAIFVHDKGGHIVDVNQRACDMLKRSPDELKQRTVRSLIIRKGGTVDVQTPLSSDSARIDVQFERSDGLPIDVEISASVVDPSEHLMQWIVRDVTEERRASTELIQYHKRLEELVGERTRELGETNERLRREVELHRNTARALEDGERKYRLLAESLTDVVWTRDLNLKYTYVSPSIERVKGYTVAEAMELRAEDELTPGGLAVVKEAFAAAMAREAAGDRESNRSVVLEVEQCRKDCSTLWAEVTITMLRDGTRPVGILGITRDISERKRVERLMTERLRYEECLAKCSQCLLMEDAAMDNPIDSTMRHLLGTTGASRIYIFENFDDPNDGLCMRETHDVAAVDVAPQGVLSLWHLPYAGALSRWRDLLSNNEVLSGLIGEFPEAERGVLTARGARSTLALPIFVGLRWVGFIGFDELVTERRWSHADVRLLRTVASMIGAYMHRKSVEATLRRAKELAEEANRLKSRIVFNVSHEIRTPLNGIIGFAEAILGAVSVESAQEQARIILRESDALLMLINDLLDHAKIEAGKMELDVQPLDLTVLLDNIKSAALIHSNAKRLELRVAMGDGVPRYVTGDFLRLRQILLNLVSNAIKFTDQGYVAVTVANVSRMGECAMLKFSVADSGVGIPKAKQHAIFDSFTQADASTTRKHGGTGLGTTIALQLVRLMGGEMTLDSELGRGSTFSFAVPLGVADPPDALVEEEEDPEGTGPCSRRRSARILLAEDYPTNQQIARLHLESAGHAVTIVENGALAIEACQGDTFDLLLMDLQMPVMDGHEAARRIRDLGGRWMKVPILAMTASAESSTRDDCIREGMDDVVTKPIRRETFLAIVEDWLRRRDSSRPGSKSQRPRTDRQSVAPESMIARSSVQRLTAAASSGEPVLDIKAALEQFGGNRALFESVVAQFVKRVDAQLPLLHEAVGRADTEQLRREAHKMKGASGSLAANRLAEAAHLLEEAAGQNKTEELEECLNLLEFEFGELVGFLLRERSREGEAGSEPVH